MRLSTPLNIFFLKPYPMNIISIFEGLHIFDSWLIQKFWTRLNADGVSIQCSYVFFQFWSIFREIFFFYKIHVITNFWKVLQNFVFFWRRFSAIWEFLSFSKLGRFPKRFRDICKMNFFVATRGESSCDGLGSALKQIATRTSF